MTSTRSAASGRVTVSAAYRRLLRSSNGACAASGLDRTSMQAYVHHRFAQVAKSPMSFDGSPSPRIKEKVLDALRVADCFDASHGNAHLASIMQVLIAGVGNDPLRKCLERGFFDLVHHEDAKVARHEADEESSSERQNQLMQQAMSPYASRLLELSNPTQTTPQSLRASVSVHTVDHGSERLVLEIDDALNKQVFYIISREGDDGREELEPMGDEEVGAEDAPSLDEEVEVMNPETLRNTTLHAECYAAAQRLYESALKETPMHRSRSSIVVGYGKGGAVGVAVALLLSSQDYNVRNAISFGSPKTLVRCMDRHVHAITPVRVVVAGDPRVEMPISSSEGDPFVHVGEILVLEAAGSEEAAAAGSTDPQNTGDKYSLQAYCDLLQSQSTLLTYAEGDEVWDEGPKAADMKEWQQRSQIPRKTWIEEQRPPE